MSAELFLKSRWGLATLLGCFLWEISLLLWGTPALVVSRGDRIVAVPLVVLAQIVPAMLLVFASGTRHQALEGLAARRLWPWRLTTCISMGALVVCIAVLVALPLGPLGTMSVFAAPITLMGLYGTGLCCATVVDRRIAGAIGTLPVLAPLTIDVDRLPLTGLWSFAISNDSPANTLPVAAAWFALGLLSTTVLGGRAPMRPRTRRSSEQE